MLYCITMHKNNIHIVIKNIVKSNYTINYFFTFALVKEKTRISLFASVLLAVFLPMVIISSVHIHNNPNINNQDLCVKCVHHVPHATHFSTHQTKVEHCLFCTFLSLQFVVATTATILFYTSKLNLLFTTPYEYIPVIACGINNTRAPPVV